MDLEEYFFYEKRKDRSLTKKTLAKRLGISVPTFDNMITFSQPITIKMALQIEESTDGVVTAMELLKISYYKLKETHLGERQNENNN
jgi:plasmid maintenance system antidote protein VapI